MADAHYERAVLLYEQSRYDLAEAALRQALADEPDDPRAHALRALCQSQLKRHDDAVESARRAVVAAPDLPFAHHAMAQVCFERRDDATALAAVEEAIRLDPENETHFALLGAVHLRGERWEAALRAAETGLRIDAEHVPCNNLRAMALVKLGRKDEAHAAIRGMLARAPEDADTHANQGWTLLEKRDLDGALNHFREALRLDAENDWARAGMVEALKARYFVYGLMLRYFLWMGKLREGARWAFIIGLMVGSRALRVVADATPAFRWVAYPLLGVYAAFVYLSWTADPIFNLMLRLNKFGRHALSRDQRVASTWVGLLFLGGLLALGLGLWLDRIELALAAPAAAFFVIPVASTFRCEEGWPRRTMGAITLGIGACGAAALIVALIYGERQPPGWSVVAAGLFVLGVMLSTWIGNGLAAVRPKL